MGATSGASFGERFTVVRRLGEGGMGVVYEAFDEERGVRVALKTMRRIDPATLFRFKNEFRALADVSHPNIVELHELVTEGDRTFFTMEYVDGVDFLDYVRGRANPALVRALDAPFRDTEAVVLRGPASSALLIAARSASRTTVACDLDRLRDALGQLSLGLVALHRAGKIHRDLKPSNVLVTTTASGAPRVVLLDFGLAAETSSDSLSADQSTAGTAEYMSPEQGAAGELNEASDWYGFGVMLYEALAGRLPFTGGRIKILMAKQEI
ncbi:MAG: serine/threonine-protein kinase, partial [Polyangiales bacterium]